MEHATAIWWPCTQLRTVGCTAVAESLPGPEPAHHPRRYRQGFRGQGTGTALQTCPPPHSIPASRTRTLFRGLCHRHFPDIGGKRQNTTVGDCLSRFAPQTVSGCAYVAELTDPSLPLVAFSLDFCGTAAENSKPRENRRARYVPCCDAT